MFIDYLTLNYIFLHILDLLLDYFMRCLYIHVLKLTLGIFFFLQILL
jgi:hypothetical protein